MSRLPVPWYWRGIACHALKPAAFLYRTAQGWRSLRRRQTAHEIPLVIVGNPRVGGSGKTPISIDAIERLKNKDRRSAWVARGVGGNGYFGLVDDHCTADQVGDEAIMAYRRLGTDCYSGVPRSKLITTASELGCVAVVSDDGMQSPDLQPDRLIVVLRAEDPWGNGLRLPAGPLREGPECLVRADLIVWHGLDRGQPELPPEADKRWVSAWYELILPDLDGSQTIGLCTSIADPERFRRSVRAQGLEESECVFGGDHRPLPLGDLDRSKTWLTTEKDWARHIHNVPRDLDLRPVGLRLRWADGGRQIEDLLEGLFQGEVGSSKTGQ